jgi:hypothetical protein
MRRALVLAFVGSLVTPAAVLATPASATSAKPLVSIGDARVAEPPTVGATADAVFKVRLDRPSDHAVFVKYKTLPKSAQSRSGMRDFYATTGMIGIRPGATEGQIRIAVRGDDRPEKVETFKVQITQAAGASVARRVATGSIDPPYALTLGRATVVEAQPNNFAVAAVTARLGAPLTVPVTFGWAAGTPRSANLSNPATGGVDFQPVLAYATIPAGKTTTSLYVLTRGDAVHEPTEQIAVVVDRRSTGVPVLNTGEITIVDNGETAVPPTTPPPSPPPTNPPPTNPPPTTTPPTTTPPTTTPPTTTPPTTTPPRTTPPTTTPPTTTPPPTRPPSQLPPPVIGPRTSNIGDFLSMRGDQVVVVPNGVYRGADTDVARPATAGPYKGWLILVAQSPYGAVVDLSTARMWLGPNASRVMFVGFKFINGSVFVEGHDINFWYTDHSFPADAWVAQAPNRNRPEDGLYRAPRTVYVWQGAQRVRFYGSDLHDTATAVISNDNTDTLFEGTKIWNLGDMGLDPNDVVHHDAIGGVGGDTLRFTMLDSWVSGRIMMQDSNGPQRDMLFQNTWVSDSPSSGFTFSVKKQGIFGSRRDIWSWGHNNRKDRIDMVNGQQIDPNSRPDKVNVADSNIRTQQPASNAVSPPDAWRFAHPLDSWIDALDS